jgi:hypothetical protein
MNAAEIIGKIEADAAAGRDLDFPAVREQIHDAAERASDTGERVKLLKIFNVVMDLVERSGAIAPENISAFRDTRAKDYRLLLLREVTIGENVSVDLLHAITEREVQAGRMREDDELRQVALKGISEPHLSVQELMKIEQERLAAETKPKGWRAWFAKK